jgi:hypothetical protein
MYVYCTLLYILVVVFAPFKMILFVTAPASMLVDLHLSGLAETIDGMMATALDLVMGPKLEAVGHVARSAVKWPK